MDVIPPEICHKIFAGACLDDGFTGRSLSLVSKYIHETSKATRFQSMALHNHEQVTAFADILERAPSRLRHVRHLFMCTRNPEPSSHPHIVLSRRTLMLMPNLASSVYGRDTSFEEAQFAIKKQNISTANAIQRILRCIAPTVQTLAMFITYDWGSMLLPLPLPNLTELTIRGFDCSSPTDESLVLFGSLRYLHIGERRHISSKDLRYISQAAPSLTHLRFTGIDDVEDLDAIPPTITNILIQVPSPPQRSHCGTNYHRYWSKIELFRRRILLLNDRITLLKAPAQQEQKGKEVLQQWLERMNGGQGCWIIPNTD